VTHPRARRATALVPLLVILVAQAMASGAPAPQQGPPPTPVPPNGSPSPFLSDLDTPRDRIAVPEVEGDAAILTDVTLDQVLVQRAPNRPLPVASLTKLMTALLVLEREAGHLDRKVRIDPDAVFGRRDYGATSTLGLRAGERISVRDLLAGLLLASANDAAEALAIEESGSVARFVTAMNRRARVLGMRETRFASPHGLDDGGRSSAADLMRLHRTVSAIPAFARLVQRRVAIVRSDRAPLRRLQNRNVMLWLYPGATGAKTGFTAGAGYCLLATARRAGRELAVVVLGGSDEVFSDAAALLNHGFAAYEVQALVDVGDPLGSVHVEGGSVPVVAGEELDALVRRGEAAAVERVFAPGRKAVYPVPSGSIVGAVRFTLSGTTLGRVPILAADLPPPDPPSGSWWGRAAGALSDAVSAVVGGLFD
jgi:serine-type D-Ala-D-Ala carboxypeptidase (penicillin-binding protein 5/6)